MPWYFILLIVLVVLFALSLIGVGTHEAIVRKRNLKDPNRRLYKVSSLAITLDGNSKENVDVLFAGSLAEILDANNTQK